MLANEAGGGMTALSEHFDEYLCALSEGGASDASPMSERELQVATAVLLVQVLRADLRVKEGELYAVVSGLETILGLGREEAAGLARVAARHARQGSAMRTAVQCVDRCLNRPQRVELAEWLWRIAFADAELAGHEEYLVRKISDLIGLSTADLVEAKVRAKESL
jgi:uncharacterized tellurite resistance protein B-like protein